jgi:hypothetical protein
MALWTADNDVACDSELSDKAELGKTVRLRKKTKGKNPAFIIVFKNETGEFSAFQVSVRGEPIARA